MSFTPHGKHLIAGTWRETGQTFQSDPAHGDAHDFAVGTPDLVNQACEAAEEAFWSFGYSTAESRAAFLTAIADEIDARARGVDDAAGVERGRTVAAVEAGTERERVQRRRWR